MVSIFDTEIVLEFLKKKKEEEIYLLPFESFYLHIKLRMKFQMEGSS